MGLIWLDSFDDRTTFGNKYSAGVASGAALVAGRTGNAMRGSTSTGAEYYTYLDSKTLGVYKTLYCGYACKGGGGSVNYHIRFKDGTTDQIGVYENANGTLSVKRGDGTVLATTVAQLVNSIWTFIEFMATIGNSDGAYELRLNGTTVLNGSGVDTQNSANARATCVRLGYETNTGAPWLTTFDDLYVASDQFYGGLRIYAKLPRAAGDLTQLTPSTSSNWTCVDEASPNDASDYVYGPSTTSEDLYRCELITDSASPYGIQLWTRHSTDDVLTRKFTPQCKSQSTDSAFAEVTPTINVWLDDVQMMPTDPATGAAWTVAGLNAAQFGIKITV